MSIKASVENVVFGSKIAIAEDHAMLGNQMGLRFILSNLISNAIKYTEEQGRVELHAGVEDARLQFVIQDNGVGMSSQQLQSLCDHSPCLKGRGFSEHA